MLQDDSVKEVHFWEMKKRGFLCIQAQKCLTEYSVCAFKGLWCDCKLKKIFFVVKQHSLISWDLLSFNLLLLRFIDVYWGFLLLITVHVCSW